MSKAVETPTTAQDETVTHDEVMEALKDVVDPELGINVVDLGLIYGLHLDPAGEGAEGADGAAALPVATIDMTLTSAACPLTDVIEEQAHSALEGMVSDVKINWVWLPPWGPDKITDEGREQLRMLGFNV
ncbi:metal-sulfur cluster assembly factor [Streptosporangium sp. NPDC023615]|uniref:metal-sulfur cluster assembly factor n=1 Tax=Streptosporangium sp. NPDC023615 TaxID=3154794 RepID=UPI00341C00ED